MSPSSQNVGEQIAHAGAAMVPAWKKELNERLAATRSRRTRNAAEQVALPGLEHMGQKVESRASRLAAKVAQRYANAPSYSEVLAAEASIREEAGSTAATPAVLAPLVLPGEPIHRSPRCRRRQRRSWGPWLRLVAPLVAPPVVPLLAPLVAPVIAPLVAPLDVPRVAEDAIVDTVEPLAVNLVEHPRELVAPRKVRPRLAEGPLRATGEQAVHDRPQLKIFEVAPESISQRASIGSAAADWSGIRLDAAAGVPVPAVSTAMPLRTAQLEDRIMAGIFDLALVVAAFAIFVLVFVACTAHPPTGKPAGIAAGLVRVDLVCCISTCSSSLLMARPGMRYAKIALCTFDDEQSHPQSHVPPGMVPRALRSSLGPGLSMGLLDPERLSWHDRLSRMYQRSYS